MPRFIVFHSFLVLVLSLGGFAKSAFADDSLDTSTLDTSSTLDTGGGGASNAKPIPGSQVLQTTYEIKEGSASEFLTKRVISLENAIRGKEEVKAEEAKARDQEIKQIVSSSLDLDRLAQRALIVYWAELGQTEKGRKQRLEYANLFKQLVEENYIEKAGTYITGKYQIPLVKERMLRKDIVVDGKILKKDVDMIVEFRLQPRADSFRVIDVKLDETSLEGSYRSSFNRIIRKQGGISEGIPELLRVMRKRLKELQTGEATRL